MFRWQEEKWWALGKFFTRHLKMHLSSPSRKEKSNEPTLGDIFKL